MTFADDPHWYKDAIIYQLHVKAFFDSDNSGIGDFQGLYEKLDYLESLGVNTLWILPFYPSPFRDDGYDISDYRGVHPEYGTLKDFRKFLREAKRRGLRVITELVINHTSDQHPWFHAARQAKPGSNKRNFYVWSDTDEKYSGTRIIFCDTEASNWTWDPVAKQYYWHRFYSHQPDLNFDNPQVFKSLMKALHYWLEMGVDGLRLDAIPYLCEREGTNNENLPETHDVIKAIRREVDEHYPGRMLLAEANQWPDDVRPYFGDGDECHMAFHFPLMPRIFISIRKEDRTPIVDIMRQMPEIPEECQWALFLRNHDELTLEMVTNDERDYMYREYASDPRMRINLGIRRRLAPLLGNGRRRIELLNSILFSFPGSPIVYYGDEIGMGDNVYLGDRNGVRTPMQWNGNMNAGFSACDPARLYSPVVMDPVYGYQRVNVESQEKEPSSLLNFMRRLIALRRQYRAFGRGSLEFFDPKNRKILAYLRRYKNEVLLCVVNLSSFSQPVELDLSEFNGWVLMELFGGVEFPRIGTLPYLLTLGPYSFYWFRLEPEAHPIESKSSVELDISEAPTLLVEDLDDSLIEEPHRRLQLDKIFAVFLQRSRWFQGKNRIIEKVVVKDAAKIGVRLHVVIVEVQYEASRPEMYLLPIRIVSGEKAEKLIQTQGDKVLAMVKTPSGGGILIDALADKRASEALVSFMHNGRRFKTLGGGEVQGYSTRELDKAVLELSSSPEIRAISGEQSNSSLVYGDRLMLKAYRKLEPGVNPEVEISRFLSERTSFKNFPQVRGWIDYFSSDGEQVALVQLSEFVPNKGVGWDFFVTAIRDQLPDLKDYVSRLAIRTAELHRALGSDKKLSAFKPGGLGPRALEGLVFSIQSRLRAAFELFNDTSILVEGASREKLHQLMHQSDAITEGANQLKETIIKTLRRHSPPTIRCHGDYHLGQVLVTEDDFFIFDFEGEPLLSIEERRRKHSALKDVAGMLRSFHYAVFEAGVESPKAVYRELSEEFIRAYRDEEDWPDEQFGPLLKLYLIDKAVYEVGYELQCRPDWVRIPVEGILNILEEL